MPSKTLAEFRRRADAVRVASRGNPLGASCVTVPQGASNLRRFTWRSRCGIAEKNRSGYRRDFA